MADKSLWPLLNQRGYAPIEFSSVLFLPLVKVVRDLGLSNTILATMFTYPTILIPFCTWLLMGYFRTIPRELEESAMIDGCIEHWSPLC